MDLAIFISIFFAEDKMIAVYKYGLFLLGIGLFWLITGANYNKLKLIYCFLAGIFLQATLGIWQFLTQSSFACKWLGMAEHDARELGTSVIETLAGERWLRAYGGLDHPNVLGGLLVAGLLVLAGLIVKNTKTYLKDTRHKKQGHKQIQNNKFKISNCLDIDYLNLNFVCILYLVSFRFIFVSCILTFTASLFFTFSRGAWLGLIVGIITMLAVAVVKKNLLAQKKLLEIILISSALVFILFSQFQDLVFTRLSNEARLEVKSNTERVDSYKDSWRMIKDNWLFGAGVGNYVGYNANLANKCQSANCEYANAKPAYFYQPVHNVFLLVWAEIGIFGLLFFIVLLLCVMRQLCRQPLCVMRYALCAAIAAMFMIDHWWWSLHFGVLLFWLVLGLMIKFDSQER
ncbi:MAG: O-antigen ligase family protein [Candidatus Falkowbacteria bacterium]